MLSYRFTTNTLSFTWRSGDHCRCEEAYLGPCKTSTMQLLCKNKYFVGNKAKGLISKRVLQENKAC